MPEQTHLSQQQQNARTPHEGQFLEQLQQQYRALLEVHCSLSDRLEDLATDWAPREEAYWREVLALLHRLRATISHLLAWLEDEERATFPLTCVQARSHMQRLLSRMDTLIDEAGIAVTAYLPHCDSTLLVHLQERHATYEHLRSLRACTQQAHTLLSDQLRLVQWGPEDVAYLSSLPPIEEQGEQQQRQEGEGEGEEEKEGDDGH